MDEQLLKDLLATARANNFNWDVIMPKFPELKGVDLQLLKDYAATAEANNYDYSVVNPKFQHKQHHHQQVSVLHRIQKLKRRISLRMVQVS